MIDAETKSNLKKVLSDAVPMLCRSGLGIYNSQISVEALIGITINNNELVLISFNELMTADGNTISHIWRKCENANNGMPPADLDRRRQRSETIGNVNSSKKRPADDSYDDANLEVNDGIDPDGICFVEHTEWDDINPEESCSKSSGKKCLRSLRASEKHLKSAKLRNNAERQIVDQSGHSRQDNVEALQTSRNSTPTIVSDIKMEQNDDDESCLFIKLENSVNEYGIGNAVTEAADHDSTYPASVRKWLWQQPSFEDCEASGSVKSLCKSSVMQKSGLRHAQKQLHKRQSGNGMHEDLTQLQLGHNNVSVTDFQSSQSAVLTPSGPLLPFPLDQHRLEPLPPTASQFAPKKRCRVCYARKVRKEVRFCCSACPDRPGLCLNPCFYEYHEIFVLPKFIQQGSVSEHGRGAVQEHHSTLYSSRPDVLHVSDVPGETGQPSDSQGTHKG